MAKKSPMQQVRDALTAIVAYQNTIATGRKVLAMPEVQKDLSIKTAQESLVRGAEDNMRSEYNAIFRRVSEHLDGIVRNSETDVIDTAKLEKVVKHFFSLKLATTESDK